MLTASFYLMILLITFFTILAAFIRRLTKEKCLKDFKNDLIDIVFVDQMIYSGRLLIENTGIELNFENKNEEGYYSKIYYKSEFSNILYFVRFHDKLDEKAMNQRKKQIKKTYHPSIFRKIFREIMNSFRTIRDSFVDIINLIIGQSHMNKILKSQEKYIDIVKKEAIEQISNSYDPLLERHIGNRVIVEIINVNIKIKYSGILKEYSNEFIELLDAKLEGEEVKIRSSDLIINRKYGIIRYLGEKIDKKEFLKINI